MVKFSTAIKQFGAQGEKTGWTYIEIPADISDQIKPGFRMTFRVKGKLDSHLVKQVAVMPIKGGGFIMPLNAEIRKLIRKKKGTIVQVQLEEDKERLKPPAALLECLNDEPEAKSFFESLTYGHQNYFTKWIESAKTEPTKTRRIAQAINALSRKMDYGTMIRSLKEDRRKML